MRKLGVFDMRVLAVAILLLIISGTTVGVQVCSYGSETHGCTWNPLTWPGCWVQILMDMGNCVMMFFISKMGDFILMNPEISVFDPFIKDIISLLFPIYVIAIAVTGVYVIFLSTEPEHRARAKLMLIRLIMGMAMVTVSMSIYQLLLNLAHAIAQQILASQGVTAGGGGGLAILSILIVVSVVFFYISAWLLPVLAIIALISIVFRYFMVSLMAVLFPLTLFFYFFEFTKGIGRNLMKYTMMAVFTQPVQALMMAIMLVGLHNVEASGGGIMALLIGLGGLIMIIAAPLFMLGLMKWIAGTVAGAGMMLAFKRPLFGAALVITGGMGTGMGPEAFVAGGSAWILGHQYQKHGPDREHGVYNRRKSRIKRATKWIAGRKTVQRGIKAFKRTRAGMKVTSGMKTLRSNVDAAGDSLYKFKTKVKAGWVRHKRAIGCSIFIPGYWIYAAGKSRMGASIKATLANKRYAATITAVKNATTSADVMNNVRDFGGKDSARELESTLPNKDKLVKDIADAIEATVQARGGRAPRSYYEAQARGIVNGYMDTLDARIIRDELRAVGVDRNTIGSIFKGNRPVNLNQFKRDAEWVTGRDKAVKYDIKAAKTFKELEEINEKYGIWKDKELEEIREKAAKGQKKLDSEETVKERREKAAKGKRKLDFKETVEESREYALEHVEEEVRRQVEDKFCMSEKELDKKAEKLMKDHGITKDEAKAHVMNEFNETVEKNVEELMKKPEMRERVEEEFLKCMKKLPEYQEVERYVERELRRSRRLPPNASEADVRKAVDAEMTKMLDKELDVIKQEKTVAAQRGMSGGDAEKFRLRDKHGELRKAFDGSIEDLPLSIDNRREVIMTSKANMAKKAIETAGTADEINAVLKRNRILQSELEESCMKAYGVSRADAQDQMRQFLDTHKRSAELALENRRDSLLKREGAIDGIRRGVKLIGLSLTPAGWIITAKIIAEGRKPFARGLQRTGLAVRTRMEESYRGRRMLSRWDAGKRRAGAKLAGAKIKSTKMMKAIRTRRLEKGLYKEFMSLGANNTSSAWLSTRLTDTYRRTNDLSGIKTSLEGWYRNKYPNMPIDEVNRKVSDFINRYDPDRARGSVLSKMDTYFYEIGGKELQTALANRFEVLDVSSDPKNAARNVVKKYRETGNVSEIEGELRKAYISKYPNMPIDEVNRNVSDFIKSISVKDTYKPELKKVSLLTGEREDIRRTRAWKAAYHSGLSLIVPFYPIALAHAAITGGELRSIALYSAEWMAASKAWKKSKEAKEKTFEFFKQSRPGIAIGEAAEIYAEIGRDVADAGRRGVAAVGRVPKAVSTGVRETTTERLKEMRTRRLEKELAKEFKGMTRVNPDRLAHNLVEEYRRTNDLTKAKKELGSWYRRSHWIQHGTPISIYEADIKAARFLGVHDPEIREPLRAKWKEGLVRRDLNLMEKELASEFTNRGVPDADKMAGELVKDYGKSNDLWQITQALKSHGAKNRISYFKERYSPEKLGEPLHKRPGSSFKRTAERIASREEEALKSRRLSSMNSGLDDEFNRLQVPATDNSVQEIKKLVDNYGTDTTDTNFTKVRDRLVEFYRNRGSSFDDAGAKSYEILRGYSPDDLSKPGFVDLRGRAQWVREHRRQIGVSLVAAPVYAPYLASRGVYAGLSRAKTMSTLRDIDNIKVTEAYRYKKLRDAMVGSGVPEAEARVLIDDHMHNKNEEIRATPPGTPRKSDLEYHDSLQREAKALVVADRTMGSRYRKLTKEFFKPFQHNKTLDEVIARGGLYSEQGMEDPKLIDIRDRAVADINRGADHEQIILRANREVDDHLIESGSFNKYLKDNIRRKYGILGSEIDKINSHLMDSRRDKITEVRRQRSTIAEPPVHARDKVNAQVLVDAHRSVQEIASVEAVNTMKPSVQVQCIEFFGGGDKEVRGVRLLTEAEKRDIIFGLDLGSNLHARMLLEDYMGIGPRPSEFYHGIGPETKEEREKEREREEGSPLYAAATVKTAELFGQISGGIEELKKPSKKGGEEK
ncbi:MAG: hypothetical protein JW778_01155 [Candidatus Altiarchaeota archaeon]|nr:hypothetical protein [Candidatus Altiarchaeota archaeon]